MSQKRLDNERGLDKRLLLGLKFLKESPELPDFDETRSPELDEAIVSLYEFWKNEFWVIKGGIKCRLFKDL